jgi:branched-chain amino acid transport system permease protein
MKTGLYRLIPLVMLSGIVLAFPGFADAYFLHLAIATLIPMILASSWDILARTGQVSVGQAALFGIGAYTAVLLYRWVHMPPVLGMLCGAVVATLVSIFIGYVTLRLRGIYFSITTIAFAEALTVIWLMVPQVTGGAMGVSAPPLFGGNRVLAYYLVVAILAATVAVVWIIQHSRLNFAFTAIRENEEVANVMGGFYSHYNTYIIPYEVFGLGISIACLVMPIFGGLYTIAGPLIGTLLIKAIEEYLRVTISYGHQIGYGLILVIVVLFMPDGLIGLWRKKIVPIFARTPNAKRLKEA